MCNIILLANANYVLTNETLIKYGSQFVKRNILLGNRTTHFMSSSKLMQKCKVFPVHVTKTYMGRRRRATLILNLGTRCRQLAFMLWPCSPRKETWYPLNRMLGKPQRQSGNFLSFRDSNPNHPAYSKSLYQLHCSSFLQIAKSPQEFKEVKFSLWPGNLTWLFYMLQSQACSYRFWYLWHMQSFRGTNQRQYWC